jgi:RNA polymerase sigma-70 factor (ECF subfamily)
VLSGDREAYSELYDRRARLIRAVCFDRTRDHESAAELTQDTFVRAYQRLATLRDREKFGAWLLGIANQVCREWLRRKARSASMVDIANAMVSTDSSAQDVTDLHRAMATLSDRERFAIHAFYVEDNKIDDVSAALQLSRSAAYHLLTQAREHMRQALSEGAGPQ